MRLLTVTPGRHPYQVLPIIGILLAGTVMIISGLEPRSMVEGGLEQPLIVTWKATLTAGAAAVLAGTYWRGRLDRGLIVEGGGHGMTAAMLTLFVVIAFSYSGWNALAAGAFIGGLGAAGYLRAIQIARQLRRLWRAEDAGQVQTVPLLVEPDQHR